MNARQRLGQVFAPSPWAKKMVWLAFVLPGSLTACWGLVLLLMWLDDAPHNGNNLQVFFSTLEIILLPAATLLLLLAALLEKRHPARALLWMGVVILLLADGALLSIMMAFELDAATIAVFLLTGVLPLALFFSLPGVYAAFRAVAEVRAVLIESLHERAAAYISARRALRLDELARLLNLPVSEADNLVDELLRAGRVNGTLDAARGWVYTAEYLAEQQRLLLEWVELRGRIHLDELAHLLKAPPATVTDWLYQLVQRGQFNGYVNWPHGMIYAVAAGKIGTNSQCPQCGGQLSAGAAGTIRCLHCGSEIFGLS
jgi:DNA-binding MarR family transcriptional regulator